MKHSYYLGPLISYMHSASSDIKGLKQTKMLLNKLICQINYNKLLFRHCNMGMRLTSESRSSGFRGLLPVSFIVIFPLESSLTLKSQILNLPLVRSNDTYSRYKEVFVICIKSSSSCSPRFPTMFQFNN